MGKCATPAFTSPPSSSSPMSTHQSRLPRRKSRVPSIGSMIQRRPLVPGLLALFFAKNGIVGERVEQDPRDDLLALFVGDGYWRKI